MDCIDGIKSPYNHVKTEISASKSIIHSFHAVLWSMDLTQKMTVQCIWVKFQNDKNILVSNIFYHFLFAVSCGNWAPKMPEKFRLDRIFCFQNTFYTKCINVIIDSIGPSIILRSILPKMKRGAYIGAHACIFFKLCILITHYIQTMKMY